MSFHICMHCAFLSSVEHISQWILCFLDPFDFHRMDKNCLSKIIENIFCVLQKKVIQVWNDMRVNYRICIIKWTIPLRRVQVRLCFKWRAITFHNMWGITSQKYIYRSSVYNRWCHFSRTFKSVTSDQPSLPTVAFSGWGVLWRRGRGGGLEGVSAALINKWL